MGKTLVIVESPAKSSKIAKFLGSNYVVKPTVGHIVDLSSRGKFNLGVDLENNFAPKYEVLPDKKDKIKAIVNAANKCEQILIASDPDREGEAIAFHIAEILKKTQKPIARIEFNEVTKKALLSAIKKPRELNEDLFNAQQARRILDRIVGFSVSPYLIKNIGPKLSAGRVQSVALRLVVDREREIEAFKPEEYWTITAELSKDTKQSFTAKYTDKITNEKQANSIKKDLESDTYYVSGLTEKEKAKKPYPPLITSSMLKAAAGKYRLSSARTMKAAQSLYEAGFITYLRTDSTRINTDAIQDCRAWLEDNGYDIPKEPNQYHTKKNAQDAHEAIRPTDVSVTSQNIFSSEDEQKVYSLIWERFVACQMNPALYDSVSVVVTTSSGHELKANGRTLKYKGWLEIMGDNNKNNDVTLPPLKLKDKLFLVDPKVTAEQKFTTPPSRFNERSLVEELEKRGIGRPSTYASIMSKITGRSYVEHKSNAFIPTEKGKKVIDELTKFFNFTNYDYTAQMENKLDSIADGQLVWTEMLDEFYSSFQQDLKKAYTSHHKDYGYRCEKCQNKMILRHGSYGFYLSCSGWPDCKNTISVDMVDDKPVIKKSASQKEPAPGVKCPNCKSGMVERQGKWGAFYSCVEYHCKGTRKVPYGKKCPKCGNELYAAIYNEENVLFCMGYPDCKHREDHPEGNLPDPKKLVKEDLPKKINKLLKKK